MPFNNVPPPLPSKRVVKPLSKLRQTPYSGKDFSQSKPSYVSGNNFLKSNQRSFNGKIENTKNVFKK